MALTKAQREQRDLQAQAKANRAANANKSAAGAAKTPAQASSLTPRDVAQQPTDPQELAKWQLETQAAARPEASPLRNPNVRRGASVDEYRQVRQAADDPARRAALPLQQTAGAQVGRVSPPAQQAMRPMLDESASPAQRAVYNPEGYDNARPYGAASPARSVIGAAREQYQASVPTTYNPTGYNNADTYGAASPAIRPMSEGSNASYSAAAEQQAASERARYAPPAANLRGQIVRESGPLGVPTAQQTPPGQQAIQLMLEGENAGYSAAAQAQATGERARYEPLRSNTPVITGETKTASSRNNAPNNQPTDEEIRAAAASYGTEWDGTRAPKATPEEIAAQARKYGTKPPPVLPTYKGTGLAARPEDKVDEIQKSTEEYNANSQNNWKGERKPLDKIPKLMDLEEPKEPRNTVYGENGEVISEYSKLDTSNYNEDGTANNGIGPNTLRGFIPGREGADPVNDPRLYQKASITGGRRDMIQKPDTKSPFYGTDAYVPQVDDKTVPSGRPFTINRRGPLEGMGPVSGQTLHWMAEQKRAQIRERQMSGAAEGASILRDVNRLNRQADKLYQSELKRTKSPRSAEKAAQTLRDHSTQLLEIRKQNTDMRNTDVYAQNAARRDDIIMRGQNMDQDYRAALIEQGYSEQQATQMAARATDFNRFIGDYFTITNEETGAPIRQPALEARVENAMGAAIYHPNAKRIGAMLGGVEKILQNVRDKTDIDVMDLGDVIDVNDDGSVKIRAGEMRDMWTTAGYDFNQWLSEWLPFGASGDVLEGAKNGKTVTLSAHLFDEAIAPAQHQMIYGNQSRENR